MSEKKKGKPCSEETKTKISVALRENLIQKNGK
jgi:hypothetical protein